MSPFRVGDRVRNKSIPGEYGIVSQVSEKCCRVILQHPLGKLWWYDFSELELL